MNVTEFELSASHADLTEAGVLANTAMTEAYVADLADHFEDKSLELAETGMGLVFGAIAITAVVKAYKNRHK